MYSKDQQAPARTTRHLRDKRRALCPLPYAVSLSIFHVRFQGLI